MTFDEYDIAKRQGKALREEVLMSNSANRTIRFPLRQQISGVRVSLWPVFHMTALLLRLPDIDRPAAGCLGPGASKKDHVGNQFLLCARVRMPLCTK